MSIIDPLVDRRVRTIRLRVNRIEKATQSDGASRLVDVLRDDFGLTGTKVGCNAGDCGACTVLLDGEQICACITPIGACQDRDIVTVEGLANENGSLNALQRAFADLGAAQCGICTPGMLMAASSLLARNSNPTENEVEDALGGVLCRCTGYRKIIAAVMAAGNMAASGPLLAPPAGQAVGQGVRRLDAADKVTGVAQFGADVMPANCFWLKVIRSPYAHAHFTLGDLCAFRKRFNLAAVLSAKDVPNNRFSIFDEPKDQPVLAEGFVRFSGEAVLALVGERSVVEAITLADIPIAWDVRPAAASVASALAATSENKLPIHAHATDNVLCRGRVVRGEVDEALGTSAHVASGEFASDYVEHAYIEPEAGYAQWLEPASPSGVPRIRIFACTQTPYMDRDEVAKVMNMAPEQIHIVPSVVGGGFGGKLDLSIQPLLAVAAAVTKASVRVVYTRSESMRSTTKRHPSAITASFACDASGQLTALDFVADFNTGAYASWGSTVANRVPVHATGPYFVPHVRALTRAVYTNNAISGAFRGFGVPQAHIATEALLDELAQKTGIDPLAFRLKNALQIGQPTATGQMLCASVGIAQCLRALEPAWQLACHEARRYNLDALDGDSPLRRGVGIASMWYGIGNTVIANPSKMKGSLRRNGRLFLYNGAQEIGQGSGTVIAQIFADAVGLPLALVDQAMGDTDLTLDAGKSSASRQTFVSGNAALFAGRDLRAQLLDRLGLSEPCLLSVRQDAGRIVLLGTSGASVGELDLADGEIDDIAVGVGYFNPPTVPLDADGQGVPYATFGFAAQFAVVEVDTMLGTSKVLAIHAAHDVGRAINPVQVEGQIEGGIAQGLGMALMERYESGKTDNLHDYLIPTIGDIPAITTYLIEDPEPLGPYGAKGVGEPALIATAPAILNAISAACGARIYSVPATPEVVLTAIRGRLDV